MVTADRIRIGAVEFLNTVSLIEGLEAWDGCSLVKAVPSRIGEMVVDGGVDIGLASIVDAAEPRNDLVMIPAGMIGCDGATLTVGLFSAVRPEEITVVHADTDSHTSVMLADVLLREVYGVEAQFRSFGAREMSGTGASSVDEAWPETVLLIGDKVVVDSPPAVRYGHQIDLGQAWHELTGLPFVYAAWMCRGEDAGRDEIRDAGRMLERVRLRNTMRLDWLVSKMAKEYGWPADLARRYIGELLRFEPDERARRAVDVFFSKLREHGIVDAGEARWVEL